MEKVIIKAYQAIYANGVRDTVQFEIPVVVKDKEDYRKRLIKELGCANLNLTTVERNIINDYDDGR